MNNPLQPLRTEILFSENRKQSELNKSVDRLVKEDRGPWDSEHRRQHDALMKKQRLAKAGTGLGILAALILWCTVGALAALQIDDSPLIADQSVCATTNPTGE